jgi:hypothetical protein
MLVDLPASAGKQNRFGYVSLAIGIISNGSPRNAESSCGLGEREAIVQPPFERMAPIDDLDGDEFGLVFTV